MFEVGATVADPEACAAHRHLAVRVVETRVLTDRNESFVELGGAGPGNFQEAQAGGLVSYLGKTPGEPVIAKTAGCHFGGKDRAAEMGKGAVFRFSPHVADPDVAVARGDQLLARIRSGCLPVGGTGGIERDIAVPFAAEDPVPLPIIFIKSLAREIGVSLLAGKDESFQFTGAIVENNRDIIDLDNPGQRQAPGPGVESGIEPAGCADYPPEGGGHGREHDGFVAKGRLPGM